MPPIPPPDAGPLLQQHAAERLSPEALNFYATGADEEITLSEAAAAWRSWRLRPRILRDVGAVRTGTRLLGSDLTSPVAVAPTAFHALAHDDAEAATARGAAAAGSLMIVSSRSTAPVRRVAEQAGPWWAQLYWLRDQDETKRYIEEVVTAGARAIVLTVDAPYVAPKARSFGPLDLPGAGQRLDPSRRDSRLEQNPELTFQAISDLRALSGLPVVVKGVLRADDAVACVAAGTAAVIVSNHGGRQLDRALPTAHALPEVARAVGDQVPVLVDGGITTGTDVLVALALGAHAVLVGRPVLWALALNGAEGVQHLLDSYRSQLELAMSLAGVPDLREISPDLVRAMT